MKPLRFAILGCGLMGREFASAAARWCHLLDMPVQPVLTAVCDTNPALFGWYQQHFASIKLATTDYREILNSPDVDAVYCAVPHHLHAELYCAIIAAGKHLLGEKPFGIDRAANDTIQAALAAHPGTFVRCSSEFPYFPAVQRIVAAARAGEFGTLLEVESGFHHSSDLDPRKPINWKRQTAFNGEYGCMGDLGLHTLHVPLRLGWQPRDVRAILSKVIRERPGPDGAPVPCETWDNATLLCTAVNPLDGQPFPLTVTQKRISPGDTNTWFLKVKGTRACMEFSTAQPKTLRFLRYTPGGTQAWSSEDLGYTPAFKTITGHIFEFGFTDAIQQMWAAFCLELSGAPVSFACATPAETAASHALFTAALQSHARGQVVAIE